MRKMKARIRTMLRKKGRKGRKAVEFPLLVYIRSIAAGQLGYISNEYLDAY
jgi:hypothetical protein